MQTNKINHTYKPNVIYPGAIQQLSFDSARNSLPQEEKTPEQRPTCTSDGDGKRQVLVDNKNIKAGYDTEATRRDERSFDLDWINYDHKARSNQANKSARGEDQKFDRTGTPRTRASNLVRGPAKNLDIRSSSSKRSNMQSSTDASQTIPRVGLLLGTDSTTVNMDDELNQFANDYYEDPNLDGQLIDGQPEIKQSMSDDYNHLDEPILDTLLRDLTGIYNKMKIIALPLSSYDIYKVVLRGWDLWGPLLLCTFLAFNLHHSEAKDNYHTGPYFADVFVLIWFGSCLISLNYRLLSMSSSQSTSTTIANQSTTATKSSATSMGLDPNYDEAGTSGDFAKVKPDGSRANMSSSKQYEMGSHFRTLLSPPSTFQLMCVFGYCLVAPCFGLILLKLFSFNRLFFERIVVGLLFGFAWPTFCSTRILIRYQHPEKRALAIYPIGLFYFVLSCMIILNH